MQCATHIMKLVVESTGVTNRLPVLVPAPQRRGRRLAVGTTGARPPRRRLQRQLSQHSRYYTSKH